MASMTRRQWLTAMGFAPVTGAVASVASRTLRPLLGTRRRWRNEPARARVQRRHLPNVALVTHDGDHVQFYDDLVRDKKVLINFIDTRLQSVASSVTANLVALQRLLGDRVAASGDIAMYTITLNPRRDTPTALAAWAEQHGVQPGWQFLTGRPAAVEKLRTALGFTFSDRAENRDPAAVMSMLKHGVKPEMRWAHCPAQASARQLALTVISDFGPDPAKPRSPQWYCNLASIQNEIR
jgi:protein SCO1/2